MNEQDATNAWTDAIIQTWCLRELAFWRAAKPDPGIVLANLIAANREHQTVFLLEVDRRSVRIADKPDWFTRTELDDPASKLPMIRRIHDYRRLIETVVEFAGLDLHTVLAMDVNDMPHARADRPVFGFQKQRDGRAILLPDIDFLLNGFYHGQAFADDLPYADKTVSAVFVGATTGGGTITADAVRQLAVPRLRTAMHFKGHPDVSFRLPTIGQCDSPETEALIRELGISGERTPHAAQFAHRFIISMDGNGATCSRVAVALKSNCVLLKYDSPHRLYYFDGLVPWLHYIPIQHDADVEAIVRLERDRPGMFAYIAEASRDFYARHLSTMKVMRYTAEILAGYNDMFPLRGAAPTAVARTEGIAGPTDCDALVHVQNEGDVWFRSEPWIGRRGSSRWIEGMSLLPKLEAIARGMRYQAMFAGGETSEWCPSGEFCGSRGRSEPLVGINIRLEGEIANAYRCSYMATSVDGDVSGPVEAGAWCRSTRLAALEAFRLFIVPA